MSLLTMRGRELRRTCLVFIIFLLIGLVCTGCWDKRELNELAIVKAIGFDIHGENGFEVTVQVINPSEVMQNKEGYDTPVTIYSETGPTVMDTIRKLTNQMPRNAYMAHIQLIVISE